MLLKILGCGTSTGVPIPGCDCAVCLSTHPRNQRDRTSAIITGPDGCTVLIDAGPDLRQQALRWKVRRVDSVLFTHAHADHILGIEDLRGFNFVHRKAIPCYGSNETLASIRNVFHYVFNPDPNYEGGMLVKLTTHQVSPLQEFEASGIPFLPFTVMHGSLPVLGFRVGSLAYATDCNFIPEESIAQLQGLKYLFLDGLRYEQHSTHFTIPAAIEIAKRIGAEQTYLVHMTHSIDYETVTRQLPGGIALAYDGLEVTFS